MKKVVICEPLGLAEEEIRQIFEPVEKAGCEIVLYSDRAEGAGALAERVRDADIVVTANQPFGEEIVGALDHCELIDVAFTGTDHIGKQSAREKNITVVNAQGYATEAVAELVIAMAIDLLRDVSLFDRLTRQGGARGTVAGMELKGKTFGILGTGAIGCRIAQLAGAFGCRVIGWSRSQREAALQAGLSYLSFDEVLAQSDILSVNVPLTDATRHLIGREALGRMKPSAILINTSRGPVVDEQALLEALRSGQIAAAGLDVFETEPPLDPKAELMALENVLLTPHIAYATRESFRDRARIVADNILAFLSGNPVNVVSD